MRRSLGAYYSGNLLPHTAVPTIKVAMTFQALLFCPDEKTARVTTQVLNELEFSVDSCAEPFAAVKKLMSQHYDAIVVDCDNEQNASLLFKSARNSSSNQASLSVAVVEGQTGVANAFRLGANLVLTKPINVEQAKSTLRVARGLLRKGSDPKGAAQGTASTAQAARVSSNPEATRPAPASVTAVAKPTAPAFEARRPVAAAPVAKTSVDAGGVLDLDDDQGPEAFKPEEILFDSPAESAHTNSAATKDYAWQPPAKSTDAMSNAMRRAAEGVESSATVHASAAAQAKPAVDLPQRAAASSSSMSYSGGAASAPAPAKEAPEKAPVQRIAPASVAPSPASAPSLGAFTSGHEAEAEDDGGNKKIIIGVVAAVVLLVVGYFGYSAMHSKAEAPKPAVQSSAPVQAAPVTAPAAQAPATQEIELSASPEPASAGGTSTARAAKPSADKEPEVTVTHPDAPKENLVVKSDLGHSASASKEQKTMAADVPAPELPGATGADPSAISSIMKSGSVAVPRVAIPPSETLKVSQGVTQGLLLKRVQPNYPAQARQMRIQGAVQLQATIAKSGNISSIKVLNGEPSLARAAVEAVKQWKYKPYYLNGEPVDIQTQITINFKLP